MGDASIADVLYGRTFSCDAGTGLTGTMPNREGDNASTAWEESGSVNYFTAPEGYYDGDDRVSATDAQVAALDTDVSAGNIRSTVTIFGVTGTFPSDGTAVAGDVKTGSTFYTTSGTKLTGTAAAGNNVNGADGAKSFTIPDGLYSGSKTATANDADLTAGNIKKDVQIFGVTGRLVDGSNATRVPKTGQTECWDESGSLIICTDTGQDGEYQLGVLPEVTPSHGVSGSYTVYGWGGVRFTDNDDGTVTDNLTGLIWLKNASCVGTKDWADALTFCNALAEGSCGLTDGSVAGNWRLPNINELHSLVDPTQSDPALPAGHPFTGVQSNYYWSSTTYASSTNLAWHVLMHNGYVSDSNKDYHDYVWPVRSGN